MLIEYYIVNLHFTKCVYKYLKINYYFKIMEFYIFSYIFYSFKNKIRLKNLLYKYFIKKLIKNMKYIKIYYFFQFNTNIVIYNIYINYIYVDTKYVYYFCNIDFILL